MSDPEELCRPFDSVDDLFLSKASGRRAERKLKVLPDISVRIEAEVLEYHSNISSGKMGCVCVFNRYASRIRHHKASDCAEESRLSRTGWAENNQ